MISYVFHTVRSIPIWQNTDRRLNNNNASLTIVNTVYGLLCSAFFVVLVLKVEDSLYVVAYFSHIYIHKSEMKKERFACIDAHI